MIDWKIKNNSIYLIIEDKEYPVSIPEINTIVCKLRAAIYEFYKTKSF